MYRHIIAKKMESEMRKLLLVFAVLLLSACGSKVDGTYSDPSGIMSYTFNSNGKMIQSTMGVQVEMKYEVEGDKVKLITPGGNLILSLLDDGSIQGPMGIKLTKKKK